jgi:hypothetical protein
VEGSQDMGFFHKPTFMWTVVIVLPKEICFWGENEQAFVGEALASISEGLRGNSTEVKPWPPVCNTDEREQLPREASMCKLKTTETARRDIHINAIRLLVNAVQNKTILNRGILNKIKSRLPNRALFQKFSCAKHLVRL